MGAPAGASTMGAPENIGKLEDSLEWEKQRRIQLEGEVEWWKAGFRPAKGGWRTRQRGVARGGELGHPRASVFEL